MTPITQNSSARCDAVVIGGGVNGLTCAALLAKAGVRTVLVEQRDVTGGCAAEGEIAPGFRAPTLAHATGPVRKDVVEELQLYLHGLTFRDQSIDVSALSPDGRALVLWNDGGKTVEGLRQWSPKDAAAWPAFQHSVLRLGGLIGTLFMSAPPSVDDPGTRDVWALMRTLRAFRGLPKADQWRLLRWGPMAVADLVSESVETELLRATLAADGIFGAMLGPWSAGSGLQMLLAAANRSLAWPGGSIVEGGPAALARALTRAAIRFGVEIRTGATVARVDVTGDRATGVTPREWRSHRVTRGRVGGRPETHVPELVRRRLPAAGIPVAAHALSLARHAGEGQPRLVGAARFHGRDARDAR